MSLPSAKYFAKRSTRERLGAAKSSAKGPAIVQVPDACPELSARQRPLCTCGKRMEVRRVMGHDAFWSCPRFPVCRYTQAIDGKRCAAYLRSRS
jgi:ssDNA-binding Zn-finger/Zn-ribbon topoisomerase 1